MGTTFWLCVVGLVQAIHAAQVCFYPNATLIALSGGATLLSSNPQSGGTKQSYSIADITFSMASTGSLVVTQNVSGKVNQLWSFNINRNCTPECKLVSQGDGNIVAYDAQGAYWGSNTCYVQEGKGCLGRPQQIILSAYWPYWFTPDNTCSVIWAITGASQRAGTPNSTYDSVFSAVTPKPLSTFFNSFGVNSHIGQGQNYRDVIKSVQFLGASTIRDGAVNDVIQVGLAGIKIDLGADHASDINGLKNNLANIQSIHTKSNNMVASIEGANEINNWPFVYNGVNYNYSCAGYAEYQRDLYSLVKNNPVFKGVAVYDLTAGNRGMDCAPQGLLQLDGMADYANIHAYTYEYPIVTAGGDTYGHGLDYDFPGWNASTPRVLTEVGVHTWINSDGSGVDNITQSKLVVGALMNAIADDFSKVFIYQLIDQVWSGYNGSESHFGLFDQFAVPKQSAKVLSQISQLLKDADGTTLKPLSFNLLGTNENVRTFLFQSQTKTSVYWLAIWQNIPVWNPDKNVPLTNPSVPVILNLGSVSASFSIYNPYSVVGVPSSGSPLIVKTVSGTQVSIDLSDYLQLVQIST